MSATLSQPNAATPPYPAPPGWPADFPHPAFLTEKDALDLLENGNRLTQPVFHAAYQRTPANFKAELIGGTVFTGSRGSRASGILQVKLSAVLGLYEDSTPGLEAATFTSTVLSNCGEVQPNFYLRIRRDHGGQTTTFSTEGGEVVRSDDDGDYVSGGPEFVLEVAKSSRAVDLGEKLRDYLAGGVKEYVVADVRSRRLRWFDLTVGDTACPVPDDGVLRSLAMPGLWLNGPALFERDGSAARATLERGLATPEHAAFVERLAADKAEKDASGTGGAAV